MDPTLAMMLFGSSGLPGLQAGIEPNSWLPPQPSPTSPPTPQMPVPAPGVAAGPPAPMPPMQSFETTNTGNPMQMVPNEPYRSEPMPQMPPTSLGAALEPSPSGVPMPRPRPAEAPQAGEAPTGATGDGLLKTLRGVQAPAAPTPQRVSTPNLPGLRPIQSGGYMDLLAMLGLGQQQGAQGGLKLPSTLGQALGGR